MRLEERVLVSWVTQNPELSVYSHQSSHKDKMRINWKQGNATINFSIEPKLHHLLKHLHFERFSLLSHVCMFTYEHICSYEPILKDSY